MTRAASHQHVPALMLLLLGLAVSVTAQRLNPGGLNPTGNGVTLTPLRRTKPTTAEEIAGNAPPLPQQLGSGVFCQDGWFPAWTGSLGHGALSRGGNPPRVLCLQVNPQASTWESAQTTCRRNNGFLLKLETQIHVGDITLQDFLERQGVDVVWTGIHNANSKFVWDELRPNLVESFVGDHEGFGKIKRGWEWNYDQFSNPDGCGLLSIKTSAPRFPPTQPPLRRLVREVTPPTEWPVSSSGSRDSSQNDGISSGVSLTYEPRGSSRDSVFHPRLRGPGLFGNHWQSAHHALESVGTQEKDKHQAAGKQMQDFKSMPRLQSTAWDRIAAASRSRPSLQTKDENELRESNDKKSSWRNTLSKKRVFQRRRNSYRLVDANSLAKHGKRLSVKFRHGPLGVGDGQFRTDPRARSRRRHAIFRRSLTGNSGSAPGSLTPQLSSPWATQSSSWAQSSLANPLRQGPPLPPNVMPSRGASVPAPSHQTPFLQSPRNSPSSSWNSGLQSPSFGNQQFSGYQSPSQQAPSFQPQVLPLQQSQQQALQQPLQQSVQQSLQQSVRQPLQQSVQQSLQQSMQQPLQQSVQQTLQQPLAQSLQQPLQQSFQQPLQQSLQQSLQQPIQQSLQQQQVQQSLQQLRQPLQQPPSLQQPLEQSIKQSLQQPLQPSLQQQQMQQSLQRFGNPMFQSPSFPNPALQAQSFQGPSIPTPSQIPRPLSPSSLLSSLRRPPLLQPPTDQTPLQANIGSLKSPTVDLPRQGGSGRSLSGSDAAFGVPSGQWEGTSTTPSTPTLYPPFMLPPDRENLQDGEEFQQGGRFRPLSGDSPSAGRGFGRLLGDFPSQGSEAGSLGGDFRNRDGGGSSQDGQWPMDASRGSQFNGRSDNLGRLLGDFRPQGGDFASQGGGEGTGVSDDAAERAKLGGFALQGNGGVLFNDKMSSDSAAYPSPSAAPASGQDLVSVINGSLPQPTALGARLRLGGFGGSNLQGLQSIPESGGEEGDQIQSDLQKLMAMFSTTTPTPDGQIFAPTVGQDATFPSPSSKTRGELDLEDMVGSGLSNETSQETNSSKEEDSSSSTSEENNSTVLMEDRKIDDLDLSSDLFGSNGDNSTSAESNETSSEVALGAPKDDAPKIDHEDATNKTHPAPSTQSSEDDGSLQTAGDQTDGGSSQTADGGDSLTPTSELRTSDTLDDPSTSRSPPQPTAADIAEFIDEVFNRRGKGSEDGGSDDDDKSDDNEDDGQLPETSTQRAASFRPLMGAEMASHSDSRLEMSLEGCQKSHPAVCFAEPIKGLRAGGDCPRGWVGHPLVNSCFKLLSTRGSYSLAQESCRTQNARLARAWSSPYIGNLSVLAATLTRPGPGGQVWVETQSPESGRCLALDERRLVAGDCSTPLPALCEKPLPMIGLASDPSQYNGGERTVVKMTSQHMGTLSCPIRVDSPYDVIVWFKDGLPLQEPGRLFQSYADQLRPRRGRNSHVSRTDLRLGTELLESVWRRQGQVMNLASLQGSYWCQVWKLRPLRSRQGPKTVVVFTDVVTLHGELRTGAIDKRTALYFNRFGLAQGPGLHFETDMAVLNQEALNLAHGVSASLKDICTSLSHVHAEGGRMEFLTYLQLRRAAPDEVKEQLAMGYMRSLYAVIRSRDSVLAAHWNTSVPVTDAMTIRMTDMCLQSYLVDTMTGRGATFPRTQPNSQAYSQELCGGVPVGVATCKGDLERGAVWDSWQVTSSCSSQPTGPRLPSVPVPDNFQSQDDSEVEHIGPALAELEEVEVREANVEDVAEKLATTVEGTERLTPPDISTMATVIHKILALPSPSLSVGQRLLRSVNKLLDASEVDIVQAEKHDKAASRILEDVDLFGETSNMAASKSMRLVTPNVAMQIWELEAGERPVIGMGARGAGSWSDPLSEPRILTIRSRSKTALTTFDVAIELPDSLVRDAVKDGNSSRLSMVIYKKAGLFRSANMVVNGSADVVNSAIISASLGGRRVENLQDKVRLVFKPFMDAPNHAKASRCVFWNFTLYALHGGWSSRGCVYNGSLDGRDVCLCDHLTNFAILLDFYGDSQPISPEHDFSLSIISIIGLTLSIFGLSMTIVSFVFFRKLRQGRAQQTLFNMAVSMLCSDVLFLVGVRQTANDYVCLVVAALLHYFVLVSFLWMLVEAVLQYLIFVKVLGTYISRYQLKTVLPAWGLPTIPIIAILSIDYRLYRGWKDYCWMDLHAFYYSFAIPVGVIILINLVMFVVIMISLARRPEGLRSNQSKHRAARTNLKAAVTIFVLLGLTWAFGYLAVAEARLAFQYVFTLLSSLQGFLLFVLLVVRRKQVREAWHQMCCKNLSRLRSRRPVAATSSNSVSSSSSGVSTASTRTLASRKGSSPLAHACADSPEARPRLPVKQ